MGQGFSRSVVILFYDATISALCFLFACLLYDANAIEPVQVEDLSYAMPQLLVTAGTTYYLCGLHRRVWSYTSISDLIAIAKASSWLTVALIPLGLFVEALVPLPVLPTQWFMSVVILGASRLAYRSMKVSRLAGTALRPPGARAAPVLMYGCSPMTSVFIHAVQSGSLSALRVVGIIDDVGDRVGRYIDRVPVLGHVRDLDRILIDLAAAGTSPQRVIVPSDRLELSPETYADLEATRARHGLEIEYVQDAIGLSGLLPAAPQPIADALPGGYERFRRFADIVGSAGALVILAPLLAVVALVVLVDLGPPLVFRQTRPGRDLKPFILFKFRSMRLAYDRSGALLPDARRTTPVGRFLRRTRLDELPQLVNVLIGDMSLIGPRPLLPRDLPEHLGQRAAVRPGITGWAQVNGGHKLTSAQKLALDRWYAQHASLGLDLQIVWGTLRTILFGERVQLRALARAAAQRLIEVDHDPEAGSLRPDWPAGSRQPRLLIVNRYFHPDHSATAQLLTDLVEALDRRGCEIRVFTSRQLYDDPDTLLPRRATFGRADVHRLPTSRFGRASLPGRVLDYVSFYVGAFLALLASARRGDVVLVETDPPLISVVGWLASRLRGARLVNWCQDLFPETAAALGLRFARGPTGQILRWLRNRSLAAAATNVVLSPTMADRLQAEGIPAKRLTIIHNWADGERIRPLAAQHNPLRDEWDLAGRFVLGYSGNLGRVHDAQSLVALMEALKDEPEILTLFIGAGNGYHELRNIFAERGIANVRFRPYQPRARLGHSLTAPDLHLVSLKPACEGLVMPSKLYGILAAGRPIAFIGADDGDAARLVREHDVGLVATPARIAGLAAAIRALRRQPERLARMGANARRAYDTAFSKDASLEAWLTCLHAAGARYAPELRPAQAADPGTDSGLPSRAIAAR
jgi:lipopolysaccharide/colanic/teichoic acid biosynthesis glycosyltransferase/glycosyltransferase involved in cell wall biosynthesis